MFCCHCGAKNREEDNFCGICGAPLPVKEPEIIYIDEKPMESVLSNGAVIVLTLFFFMLSLITIISISTITRDIPTSKKLEGITSYNLY